VCHVLLLLTVDIAICCAQKGPAVLALVRYHPALTAFLHHFTRLPAYLQHPIISCTVERASLRRRVSTPLCFPTRILPTLPQDQPSSKLRTWAAAGGNAPQRGALTPPICSTPQLDPH
jgi:hypothetical protein